MYFYVYPFFVYICSRGFIESQEGCGPIQKYVQTSPVLSCRRLQGLRLLRCPRRAENPPQADLEDQLENQNRTSTGAPTLKNLFQVRSSGERLQRTNGEKALQNLWPKLPSYKDPPNRTQKLAMTYSRQAHKTSTGAGSGPQKKARSHLPQS